MNLARLTTVQRCNPPLSAIQCTALHTSTQDAHTAGQSVRVCESLTLTVSAISLRSPCVRRRVSECVAPRGRSRTDRPPPPTKKTQTRSRARFNIEYGGTHERRRAFHLASTLCPRARTRAPRWLLRHISAGRLRGITSGEALRRGETHTALREGMRERTAYCNGFTVV